ncbi:MAG TPA: NB-ARC domain-containing protein, partial [Synergistaceae bacterium]|nr:NB-ARC domain-containing protein [Synergistaceae bacterium]
FVGILGHLYGSCPQGSDQSYTEREYDAAADAGKPMLMFVAPRDFPVPADLIELDEKREKQKAFRERVRRIRADFKSPDNLALRVTQAIRNEEYKIPEIEKHASRVPFLAPPLPEHFVPRPEKSDEVKRRLLTNIPDRPGVLVVSALHGLGGIGKTVLASSLAHNDEVRDHFPDGILWATLGQEPDLLSLLSGWIQALGDYEFRPTTPEAASMHLSTLLHDKTALLVVDDAWNSAHVQPFRVGGPRCSLLITTRDSLIAEAVGARVYDLDVMTEGQSLALLSNRLGRELGETERQEALDLAKVVGYLPLALNLIAAQVEDGVSWAELLEELRAEIARLEALEKPGVEELDEATRRNLSLRASFRLSIQSMPEKKRVAFAWLG